MNIRPILSLALLSSLALGGLPTVCAQDEVAPPAPATQDPKKPAEEQKPKVLELGGTLGRAIQMVDIDGETLDSRALRNKVVVVNFWATRCPIMQGWEQRYAAIHREYAEQGVAFVTINSNAGNGELSKDAVQGRPPVAPTEAEAKQTYPEIRAVLRENKLPYRVLVDADAKIADLFGAKTTPHVFVFDTSGKLVYKGLIDDDLRQKKGEKAKHHLRDVLDTLLDEDAELEPYVTREQGCGIKRPRPQGEQTGRRRGGRGRRGGGQ